MKKKIGISAPTLCQPYTGRYVYIINLLKALSKINDENEYLIFTYDKPEINLNLPQNFKLIVIPLDEKLSSPKVWDKKFTQSPLFKSVKVDVLLLTYFVIPICKDIKLAIIIHDLNLTEFYTFKKLFSGNFPFKLLSIDGIRGRIFEPFLIKKADRVAGISSKVCNDIYRILKVPEEKISKIYNGIDHIPTEVVETNKIISQFESLDLNENFILYVGGCGYKKNIKRLVDAYRQAKASFDKPHQLVIVGDGFWRKKLEKRNYQEVIWLNKMSHDLLMILYKKAKLFVFPSMMEGFGFPPIEAKILGTPVITSINSPMEEVLNNEASYFDPYSTEDLKNKLIETVNNLPPRVPLSQKKIERFSWDNCAEGVYKMLKELL